MAAAREKLRQHPEPEARFLRTTGGKVPAYHVQIAVDEQQALIVTQQVSDEATDNRSLQPMAEAAQAVVSKPGQTLFQRSELQYDKASDTMVCPAGQRLHRHQKKNRCLVYAGRIKTCGACALKQCCTIGPRRLVKGHVQEEALERMQQPATPEAMRLRKSIAEPPFAALKYHLSAIRAFCCVG